VTCSKGTYIRALARDFGARLGCGAMLFSLKRTRHGEFLEEMSVSIDSFKTDEDLLKYLVPLEQVVLPARETRVEMAFEKFLKQGMPIPLLGGSREWGNGDVTKLMNMKGALIGIGTVDTVSKTIKIKRLIND
jgi:tRNA pseudouridine55 synthase